MSPRSTIPIAGFTFGLALACGGGEEPGTSDNPTLDASVQAVQMCLTVPAEKTNVRRCGLIDRLGNWVLAPQFASLPKRPRGSFVAKLPGDRVAIVDRSGSQIVVRETALVGRTTEMSEDVFGYWPADDKKHGWLVDAHGERVGAQSFQDLQTARVTARTALADFSVGRSASKELVFDDGLACVNRADRGGWGYLRPDGSLAFEQRGAKPLIGGAAVVNRTLIDRTGKVLREAVLGYTPFLEDLGG